MIKKWLAVGAAGVACLVAGAWLIVSGASSDAGRIVGVAGVLLVLVSMAGFAFTPRFLLLSPRQRGLFFGATMAVRILKVLAVLLVAVVVFLVFMTT
jgi:hypothetical protein